MTEREQQQFFTEIAIKSSCDIQVVKNVFNAMIRVIMANLRNKKEIDIPNWGIFKITTHKSRRSLNVNTGKIEVLPEKKTIKFDACKALKYYVRNMTGVNS